MQMKVPAGGNANDSVDSENPLETIGVTTISGHRHMHAYTHAAASP